VEMKLCFVVENQKRKIVHYGESKMEIFGKCFICRREEVLDEMFFQDNDGNRISLYVCEKCMMYNLFEGLKKNIMSGENPDFSLLKDIEKAKKEYIE
jgi:uncharacterized protein YlaI